MKKRVTEIYLPPEVEAELQEAGAQASSDVVSDKKVCCDTTCSVCAPLALFFKKSGKRFGEGGVGVHAMSIVKNFVARCRYR